MKIQSNRLMMNSYQQTTNKTIDNKKTSKKQSVDQLEISTQAQEILKNSKESRITEASKLHELKDRIAQGSYRADSERIADKLISLWTKTSND